ncbi:MAG: DsrE family protein [Myxococcaceae bacterium]|jgi:peroxiredoxin family protein|nr:DsrE family protein [Myxococcaceae bacterium]
MAVSRLMIFVSSGGYEAAWQATSLGLTAAAMGDDVVYVFAFDALRALSRGTFGKPLTERESAAATRGTGLGAPVPSSMLTDSRQLGAKAIACDTTVKLCGLDPADLLKKKVLDEVTGLPDIWKLTTAARLLSF